MSAPRAVIHKKILDVAAANPSATMAQVADDVSGASTDIVERVLSEYGDPVADGADDGSATDDADSVDDETPQETESPTEGTGSDGSPTGGTDGGDGSVAPNAGAELADGGTLTGDKRSQQEEVASHDSTDDSVEERDVSGSDDGDGPAAHETTDRSATGDPDLDERDRALLSAVAARPDATQAVIAEELDVSRATVSRRVNGVAGLEWDSRAEFVSELVENREIEPGDTAGDAGESDDADRLDDVAESADATPGGTDERSAGDGNTETVDGPDSGETANRGGDADSNQSEDGSASTTGSAPNSDSELLARLGAIETQLDDIGDGTGDDVFDDPELVHKVVGACMDSDRLTEDEEVDVLAALMD